MAWPIATYQKLYIKYCQKALSSFQIRTISENLSNKSKNFLQTFTENDFCQKISIPIINDNQYNPDTDFYMILKNPSGNAALGDPSVTRITIIDDDSK